MSISGEPQFSAVKIDRLPLQISLEAGSICIAPADTVYFTVPAKLVSALKNDYGIDLQKRQHRKSLQIKATLVKERVSLPDTADDPFELRLVYTLKKDGW